jgi:hypothetical protein
MQKLLAGSLFAATIAALLVLVTEGGEHGWKYALAVLGLVLWVAGGLWKDS